MALWTGLAACRGADGQQTKASTCSPATSASRPLRRHGVGCGYTSAADKEKATGEDSHDGFVAATGSQSTDQRFLSAATSSARSFGASLSSTPLTYLCPSIPPKDLVSSTASLMTTRYGISRLFFNSYAPISSTPCSIGDYSLMPRSTSGAKLSRSATQSLMAPYSSTVKWSPSALSKPWAARMWLTTVAASSLLSSH